MVVGAAQEDTHTVHQQSVVDPTQHEGIEVQLEQAVGDDAHQAGPDEALTATQGGASNEGN